MKKTILFTAAAILYSMYWVAAARADDTPTHGPLAPVVTFHAGSQKSAATVPPSHGGVAYCSVDSKGNLMCGTPVDLAGKVTAPKGNVK